MIVRLKLTVILTLFSLVFFGTAAFAVDKEYKEYKLPSSESAEPYFEIQFDASYIEFTILGDDETEESTGYYRRDLKIRENKVYVDDRVVIDRSGLHLLGQDLTWDRIHSVRVDKAGEQTRLTFYHKMDDSQGAIRRRGNIVEYDQKVEVDLQDFVRGSIIAVLGDVRVDGEVNRDIVALFGDVRLGPDAVARGDIAAMTGSVAVAKTASLYGALYETTSDERARNKRRGRRGRFYRESKGMDLTVGFIYNRVDGAHPWAEYTFSDQDSLLPTVALKGGYAFNSKRWRYDVSVEQTVFRDLPITVGGGLHRRLDSGDRWLLDDPENTVFSILANEDYMDYYEAEGGSIFARVKPITNLTLEGRYQYDETKWLSSRAHLWTLFGGSKLFRENYSSVDSSFRASGIEEIDSTALGSLYFVAKYDDVSELKSFPFSGLRASFELEWSDPDLNSDFNFHRYTAGANQYIRLNRRAMLTVGLRYGNSTGYVPMHKRFFLGGLGSLKGYDHKEFMGTEFWMSNIEYRFELPGTSTSFGLLYDVGQIANEVNLDSDAEVLHSVGLAWYLDDDIRLSLSKRLDDSENDDPTLLVRLTGGFNYGVETGW